MGNEGGSTFVGERATATKLDAAAVRTRIWEELDEVAEILEGAQGSGSLSSEYLAHCDPEMMENGRVTHRGQSWPGESPRQWGEQGRGRRALATRPQ